MAAADAKTAPLLSDAIREKIRAYIPRYPSKRAVTLPALHIVHEHLRCVPYRAMDEIAELLEIEPADVHDTMSFYGFFPQAPIGESRLWICRSISCMLRGGDELLGTRLRGRRGRRAGRHRRRRQDHRRVRRVPRDLRLRPGRPRDDGRIYGPLDEQKIDVR